MGADLQEQNSSGFEGFEKRLEVEFEGEGPDYAHVNGSGGLRSLSREQLQEMLKAAECTIVSERHNQWFDAYVLSESSLFVYPRQLVMKTCGKTRLLNAIPVVLSHASSLSLQAKRCKYSRGSFIFPDVQPFPYTSFSEEVRVLDELFAPMLVGGSRTAHVLDGDPDLGSSSWHIYTAMAAGMDPPHVGDQNKVSVSPFPPAPFKSRSTGEVCAPILIRTVDTSTEAGDECIKGFSAMPSTYTLEMCMTHLHPSSASHFMNPSGTKSGADMTHVSGISSLLPNALISDFAFSPCGYSMNGLEKDALSTIHITPEEGHSYASFEVMGYDPSSLDLQDLINRVVACFKPGTLVMSIHALSIGVAHGGLKSSCNSWCTSQVVPQGYVCKSSVRQELARNGVIAFHAFTRGSSFEEEIGVIPKPLCRHANIVAAAADDSLVRSKCGHVVVPSIAGQQGGCTAVFELEDSIVETAVFDSCMSQANSTHSLCGQVFHPLKVIPTHRGAHEGLKTHMSICRDVMFTIVNSEMELSQLQRCDPNAKVVLRLQPESKGCHFGLSLNAEELLRKSKRLGLEVIGIAVDEGAEPSAGMGVHKGAIIKAASRVCVRAKALGMPHLKLLSIGQCA